MRSVRPEPQFATLAQQTETAQIGMWMFIATEVMFFGALVFTYVVYRTSYGAEFTLAGRDTRMLLGSINTAILLTSSLTMVLAIDAAREGLERPLVILLLLTAVLGVLFLGVKGYEYALDYADHKVPRVNFLLKPGEPPSVELFWIFYWIATGVHALHLTIGIAVVLVLAWMARRGAFSRVYYSPLEVAGLYWSFVDVVWLFLFAALYPLGRAP
jgi:cytochrome c oxidase subunit 3